MHPFIYPFGIRIPSYGLLMLTGLTVSFILLYFRSKKNELDTSSVTNLALFSIAGGLIGLFLFKPIINLPKVIINFDKYLSLGVEGAFTAIFGELVFYGGIIGGAIFCIIFCRTFKLPLLKSIDLLVPCIPIGHAIGRLGCFFGGCCYGAEVHADCFLAVIYPPYGIPGAAPPGIPLLPVPLIEAFFDIVIFVIILLLEKKIKTDGFNLIVYGILYSVLRFTLEFFRGDLVRGQFLGISTSQFVSIFFFAICVFLLIKLLIKRKKTVL